MIIIKISSGLGNQLFQYALYLNFIKHNIECKFDTSFYSSVNNEGRTLDINHLFDISFNVASTDEISSLKSRSNFYNNYLNGKYVKKVGINSYKYFDHIFEFRNCYLDGYWQNINYINNVANEIKENLIFSEKVKSLPKNLEHYLKSILDTNSVSIHIRRGDYFGHKLLGNVVNIDYYNRAINEIYLRFENPHFFIFSDDISWCQKNLKISNSTFIKNIYPNSHFFDFYLMSMCKNNIIANSSFSWWSSWLNANLNKFVILPNNWINSNPKIVELAPKGCILL